MTAEIIRPLTLAANPANKLVVRQNAAATIEDFLGQLPLPQQAEILRQLIRGEVLESRHGDRGHGLAANRLVSMLTGIGYAAGELSDVYVYDLPSGGRITTSVALSNIALIK
jgi:hypothetical protein